MWASSAKVLPQTSQNLADPAIHSLRIAQMKQPRDLLKRKVLFEAQLQQESFILRKPLYQPLQPPAQLVRDDGGFRTRSFIGNVLQHLSRLFPLVCVTRTQKPPLAA